MSTIYSAPPPAAISVPAAVAAVAAAEEEPRMDARRAVNVALAVLLIVLFLPLMALIAILVKLDSRGPVLYTQARVGIDRRAGRPDPEGRRLVDYGGRLFRIYKYRTMHVASARQTWASPDDPRVTRLGKILRKTRLDELPQLFNVLTGDMNLVGPRPEQPGLFIELREKIPGYALRQRVLPGLTGWAQVNQSYDRTLDDVRRKVALDLEYIHRASPLHDLRIVAVTIPALLLRGRGW
jgi:lipopolysaccharide/colanic/teichoic acid biosynthesis glycosyltransferase